MTNNQEIIKSKIHEFVKKFYLNKLYKGVLVFLIITLIVYLSFTILEYFSYLNTTLRLVLFYTFLLLFLFTTIKNILYPLFKLLGLGKQIDKNTIAKLIGTYFPQIDDKLLNVFQLEQLQQEGKFKSYDLLISAIDSKIETIKPFPFVKAIPFKTTKKYLKWAIFPVIIFITIFSIKSEIITESTKRIIQYNKEFEKPAPYSFELMNNKLSAFQNEDYVLKIKVKGEETPKEIYISYGDRTYRCQKESPTIFFYNFVNLQQSIDFQLQTEEVQSKNFLLEVFPKAITVSFSMEFIYPSYLNKTNETIENNGDATVPEGTKIIWKVYTKNTEKLVVFIDQKDYIINSQKDLFTFFQVAKTPFQYSLLNSNLNFISKDTIHHQINVIKDLYPEVFVESQKDSLFADRVYFKGTIKDDYGFKGLKFVYTKSDLNGNLLEKSKEIPIQISNSVNIQDFYFYFDASILLLNPGDQIEYYFEVFDNDGYNGSKSTKTQVQNFKLKTIEEIEKELDKSNSDTKNDLKNLIKESEELVKDINKFQQQLMQNNQITWQDKKRLESLLEEYKNIKNKIEEIKENQKDQKAKENKYKNIPEEILKKQEELMKRFDSILSDEVKQMLEKIQEMMKNENKDQLQKEMDKIKMSTQDINKELDQQMELFKLLEFEKKFQNVIEKSRQLAEEQKHLSRLAEEKAISKEELLEKQEQLNQKFDQLQKDLKELQNLNKSMEEPIKMQDRSQQEQGIKNDMKEAKDQLNKNNRSKAKEKQNSASESLNKLADELEQEKNEAENEDIGEDIESLRQIMDNLIRVSFKQEDNLKQTFSLNPKSPRVTEVIRTQKEISDYIKMIDDSLSSLAKRQTSIKPFIQKELQKIREYLMAVQTNMTDRQFPVSSTNQQFALTSINNLTLMLAESMKEMKEKQKESNGKCNKTGGKSSSSKTGGKKSKPKSARELQQQLNRQMESLKRSMDQKGKPGQTGQDKQFSEQFAKMAAQQEAIRKMLQDYNNELKEQTGFGDKSVEQLLKEMEMTEKDLVNRVISTQTINRQKQIETRLLESERAEMEREKQEERESKEAQERYNPQPPKEWNFQKEKVKQTEMIKTIPPSLQYYYKEKANQYFYNIE